MTKKIININLANPRGFCAGVVRAIEIVEKSIEKYGPPIYVRHEVVHNKFVIENLKKKGAIFTDNIDEIPMNSHVIFSAHGVSKKIREESKQYQLKPIDATCPLVTKVHNEVNHYLNNDYEIIMIGHKGHPEVEGTLGQEAESAKMFLVENESDIKKIKVKNKDKLAYVTQTTLSLDETRNIISKLITAFPNIKGPKADDICYATQNRQDAVNNQLDKAELLIVVGSNNSSNSNRLKELGDKKNIESYLVDSPKSIKSEWFNNKKEVLLTGGASAPEELIKSIIERIASLTNIKINEFNGVKENIIFKLPKI
jgi:4-hydroxy-3-methylbut-2-enyl diphosphate reductase